MASSSRLRTSRGGMFTIITVEAPSCDPVLSSMPSRVGEVCRSGMQAAFGLGGTGPATGPAVLPGAQPPGARSTADRAVTLAQQRVDQDAVIGDVFGHLLVGPGRDRVELDHAVLGVPLDYLGASPLGRVGAAQAGRP